MSTMEEMLQAYLDAGVDPTMADFNVQSAYNRVDPSAMGVGAGHIMAGGNASRVPTMSPLSNLSSVESMLNEKELSNQMQSLRNAIKDLTSMSKLQIDAQQRIANQQISMQQAQWRVPEAYSNFAPGLQYQTDSRSAVFRDQLTSGGLNLAQRPQASFFQDMLMSNTALRPYYEPSFAEDPYMGVLNANRRMQERIDTAVRGGTNLGAQIAGGGVSWGLAKAGGSKLAASALTRLGLGTAVAGPIGTVAAIGDIALDMMGLPSISGTVSKGVDAAWDATIGRHFTNLDMAKDIQKMTPFMVGTAAGASGQGLSLERSGRIVSSLNKMAASDIYLDKEDYLGIFQTSAQEGLLSQSANEEVMLKNIRSISKNLRLFMRVSGDPDYKNAIKQMGELYRLGVPQEEMGSAVKNIQNLSRMAGLNFEQTRVFGQQGAMIFQNAGANMGTGYQTGIMARAFGRATAQTGALSPSMLAQMGGEEGISQNLTEILGSYLGGPTGRLSIAGLLKKDASGRLSVDKEKVKNFTNGTMGVDDLLKSSERVLNSSTAIADFAARSDQLANDVTQGLGPTAGINLILQSIKRVQKENPFLSYEGAATAVLGQGRGYAFTRMVNPRTIREMEEAERTANRQQSFNETQILKNERSFFNRMGRNISEFAYDAFGKPIDDITLGSNRSREIDEFNKVGRVYRDTLSSSALTKSFVNEMMEGKSELIANRSKKAREVLEEVISLSPIQHNIKRDIEIQKDFINPEELLSFDAIKKYSSSLGGKAPSREQVQSLYKDIARNARKKYGSTWDQLSEDDKRRVQKNAVNAAAAKIGAKNKKLGDDLRSASVPMADELTKGAERLNKDYGFTLITEDGGKQVSTAIVAEAVNSLTSASNLESLRKELGDDFSWKDTLEMLRVGAGESAGEVTEVGGAAFNAARQKWGKDLNLTEFRKKAESLYQTTVDDRGRKAVNLLKGGSREAFEKNIVKLLGRDALKEGFNTAGVKSAEETSLSGMKALMGSIQKVYDVGEGGLAGINSQEVSSVGGKLDITNRLAGEITDILKATIGKDSGKDIKEARDAAYIGIQAAKARNQKTMSSSNHSGITNFVG